VVRHKGREVRLDLRCEDPSEMAFAAFYADCVHEVLPVTSGCRLALVYNLLRRGKGPRPQPPSYEGEQVRAAALLQAWAAGKSSPDDDTPEKLIYPLEHAYTPAELGFDALKGADAAVAGVLAAAARQSGCDLHLALVSIEESGPAEHTGGYGWGRRRWSEPEEDEFEVVEVSERYVTLSEWRRPDGSPSPLGPIPVEEEELSPPDAFDEMEPDEEHFLEATGNEGASFERTYRRAALVLWPRERIFAVLSQAGLAVTLPYLDDLTERWAASGGDRGSPLWREAHELSGHMLSGWPTYGWYPGHDREPSDATRMLTLLTRLEDAVRIDAFLAGIAAQGLCGKGDNDAILGALGLLPPRRAALLIERIIAGTSETSLGMCGDLLARAAAAWPHGRRRDLVRAATALVEALPGNPERAAPPTTWRRERGMEPGFIVDLFTALVRIDEALAGRAADHILAWPKTYDLDTVLVPAVRRLVGSTGTEGSAAVQRLRTACLEHLRARVAEPLEAPRDWSRASKLPCRCPDCSELSRFLADPERKTWVLKAAEPIRGHVEDTIRKARCDLDVMTERRGRPYSLVCTKNQASYERRVTQRKEDLENLERLDA
ncbi:MAG: 2OG-Fe(II) oxygenase, partial [Pseudomonadota bacterium]|nr:2OG-Fe(II) oxygenase [Pseudomonadota bacterium]